MLAVLCVGSVVAATYLPTLSLLTLGRLSSILATNTLTLVLIFRINFNQAASLTGYFLLGVGCSAWMTSATARVYGKRHTYVFGSLLLVGGSIWGAVANDYKSLLGARIMQGFGTGPFEMLVPSSIGDMYVPLSSKFIIVGILSISAASVSPSRPCRCLVFLS